MNKKREISFGLRTAKASIICLFIDGFLNSHNLGTICKLRHMQEVSILIYSADFLFRQLTVEKIIENEQKIWRIET